LAKFAKEIGIAKCTVDRYRTVYRAWKEKLAPGPNLPSYAVLRELATHPEREQIIRDNPNLTKSEACDIRLKLKSAGQGAKQQKLEKDRRKDDRRWFKELYTMVKTAGDEADAMLESTPEKQRELLAVVDGLMLMNLRGHGNRLVRFADHFEKLLEEEEAAESAKRAEAKASKIKPVHPEASAHVMA
jgi:hypothetical protein